jgi:DNA-directed RNA polymerase subunit RPC12/RpoP
MSRLYPKHRCLDCGAPLYHRTGQVSLRCRSCNMKRLAKIRWASHIKKVDVEAVSV